MSETCKDKICPFLSARKDTKCIEHRCAHYQHLLGRHPQSGEVIDAWDCAFSWHNILLIEGAQQTRQAAAAIESFRNEMVKGNERAAQLLLDNRDRLIGQNDENNDHP